MHASTTAAGTDRISRGAWRAGLSLLLCCVLNACDSTPRVPDHLRVVGGDPAQGERLVTRYACGACHVIPNVKGANSYVGPPLNMFGRRTLIGGHVPNTPDNLVRWIMDPPSIAPRTAMPAVGVSRDEARHIAAYLYTLR
jgi:cytochrome c1